MKEGIVPVPQYLPFAERDDNVFTVQGVIAFFGSQGGGGETTVSVSLLMEHFYRAKYSTIFMVRV